MAIAAQYVARAYVDLPAPEHKVGGLFSVATVIDVTDPHILMGAQALTTACEPASIWEHVCPILFPATCAGASNPSGYAKKVAHGLEVVTGDPFTVYDSIDCKDKADYTDEVRAGLALKEQKAVEKHMLALLNAATSGGTPGNITEAVAQAEEWLGDNYEGLGVIHMGLKEAVHAAAAEVIAPALDGSLATVLGTPVVAGSGYKTAGSGVIFASGQIVLYRGPVMAQQVPGVQGPTKADCHPARALAERTYVPLIECGAAKFTITKPAGP
jgi:hypothetical protein